MTKYACDGDDILYEFDGNNALKARHTHGPGVDDPLYTQVPSGTGGPGRIFYYHKDGLNSVREVTDGEGKVVHRNEYDSFGNILKINDCDYDPSSTSTLTYDFLFTYAYTGRQWDPEIGMYYYRARYYDARIGRFISEDPEWSVNLYNYVGNNPIMNVDPSGRWLMLAFAPWIYIGYAIGMSYLNSMVGIFKGISYGRLYEIAYGNSIWADDVREYMKEGLGGGYLDYLKVIQAKIILASSPPKFDKHHSQIKPYKPYVRKGIDKHDAQLKNIPLQQEVGIPQEVKDASEAAIETATDSNVQYAVSVAAVSCPLAYTGLSTGVGLTPATW